MIDYIKKGVFVEAKRNKKYLTIISVIVHCGHFDECVFD